MSAAEEVGRALKVRGWTIACAESCTGGLLTSRLTDVAGSSAYVKGGVISYATEVKIGLLKVRAETIARYGVVSEETAIEMACGVRRLLGTDIGLSTTGFAGPTGDDVGLVCVGLSTAGGAEAVRFKLDGDRLGIKTLAVESALEYVLGSMATAEVGSLRVE